MPRPSAIAHRAASLLARVLIALLFGVIVSIAIAIWAANADRGRALWIRTPATGAPVSKMWQIQVTGYKYVTTTSMSLQGPNPLHHPDAPEGLRDYPIAFFPDADSRAAATRLLTGYPSSGFFSLHSAGWPRQCLAWQSPPVPFSGQLAPTGVRITWRPPFTGRSIGIPTIPLWRHLTLNSTLLGSPLLLILLATPPLRRLHRRRRGLCPLCAYDLNHNLPAGCPECGWNRSPPTA